jgi:hypothetical protein
MARVAAVVMVTCMRAVTPEDSGQRYPDLRWDSTGEG